MDMQMLEDDHTSGFYAKRNVVLVRGEGARIWDVDGNEYIDCATGLFCAGMQCRKVCRVGRAGDCTVGTCTGLTTPVVIGSTEYGGCI